MSQNCFNLIQFLSLHEREREKLIADFDFFVVKYKNQQKMNDREVKKRNLFHFILLNCLDFFRVRERRIERSIQRQQLLKY